MSQDYTAWVGRTVTATDTITARDARRMALTLDVAPPETILPPLWHWMGWSPEAPHADLATDGHLRRGGFLPPVPLERRMWAGGKLAFHGDLHIDEPLTRRSEIVKVSEKSGVSGQMVFVTVAHHTAGAHGHIDETQDIVFIAIPDRYTPPPPQPAPENPDWSHPFHADPVRLFRFSALTFNGHRIHYDLPYAQGTEHYPGLVVHGPLQAMALLHRATEHARQTPKIFSFRGVRPAFAGTLQLQSWGNKLATVDLEGNQCMTAEVTY